MSSPAQVSQYGPYIDLQNYTGSAAPGTSGSLWLSGSNAGERLHANVNLAAPGLKLASTVEVVGILDEDNMASDSATNLATQQSIKAYVDSQVGGQDLDFSTDSGAGSVDLDSQTLALAGDSGLDVTHSGQTVTYSLDLNELSAITATADADQITVVDATDNSTKKITRANLFGAAAANFSSGLSASFMSGSGVLKVGGAATFAANVLPLADDASDLGSSALKWKDLYLDGVAYVDDIHAADCDINGGTIDGVTIGTNSAISNGVFTAFTASYAKVDVLDVNTINSVTQTQNSLEIQDFKVVSALSASSANADDGGFQIGGGASDTGIAAVVWSHSDQAMVLRSGSTDVAFVHASGFDPGADNTFDLGGASNEWRNLYIDGQAFIDQLGEALDANSKDITSVGNLGTTALTASVSSLGVATVSSLDVGDGNITNVGDINCDSVSVDDAAVGLDIIFGGNTGLNNITMTNNLADALSIKDSSGDYIKFVSTSGQEGIEFGKESEFTEGALVYDNKKLTLGTDDDAYIQYNSTGDVLVVSGTYTGSVVYGAWAPATDDTFDLGSSGSQWRNLYIDGIAHIDDLRADALGAALNCASQAMTNVNIDSGAIDGVTLGATNVLNATAVDIDGATDIGAALTTADLFLVDDGAAGTNRKSTLARLVTLMESEINELGSTTFGGNVTIGSNGSGYNFKVFGTAANEYIEYDASEHTLEWVDSSGASHLKIGGDSNGEYAIDVVAGSNNKNKIRAASFVTYSDERLKSDVSPMRNALETVNSLNAVNFTWKKDGSRDFGFMAQELKKSIPQAVHGNEEGLFGVDYGRLTAVLVSAIQEQSAQIKDLQAKLNKK